MDYCKFFQDIEKDPKAPIDITVGEFYSAAEHTNTCKDCLAICERVAALDDGHDRGISVSLN